MPQVGANNEPLHEAALFGFDGGSWQRLALLFGYTDTYRGSGSNTSLAAGVNTIDIAAIPAGKIAVVTNIAIRYDGTVTGVRLVPMLILSGTGYELFMQSPPVSITWYDRQGYWVLKAGDNVRLYVSGATLNDDAFIRATGYLMNVA